MVVKNLSVGMTRDRAKWRRVIHVADPFEWDKVYVDDDDDDDLVFGLNTMRQQTPPC